MSHAFRIGAVSLLCVSVSLIATGQQSARLRTSDTELVLEAGPTAPQVKTFSYPGNPAWENRESEALIDFVQISEKQIPVRWAFNRDASHVNAQQVAFVYDSASPHLRVTWEWRIRQDYGPIEHQIRIENLENQEIWIPMQDSLAFNWKVDPGAKLQHLFVEKGANTPSAVGTHEVPLARRL